MVTTTVNLLLLSRVNYPVLWSEKCCGNSGVELLFPWESPVFFFRFLISLFWGFFVGKKKRSTRFRLITLCARRHTIYVISELPLNSSWHMSYCGWQDESLSKNIMNCCQCHINEWIKNKQLQEERWKMRVGLSNFLRRNMFVVWHESESYQIRNFTVFFHLMIFVPFYALKSLLSIKIDLFIMLILKGLKFT